MKKCEEEVSLAVDVGDKKSARKNQYLNTFIYGILCGVFCSLLIVLSQVISLDNGSRSSENFIAKYSIRINEISSQQTSATASMNSSEFSNYVNNDAKILCFVLPLNKAALNYSAKFLLLTWTKRCNKLVFFIDEAGD
jgi:hypothetical protein